MQPLKLGGRTPFPRQDKLYIVYSFTCLSPSDLCLGSPQHPHTTSSRVSLSSLHLGRFPYNLTYISFAATEVGGLERSVYILFLLSLSTPSFLLNWMLGLSLLLFFLDMQLAQMEPSLQLSTMRGCSTNKAELQEILGVKNICLSS